MSNIRLVIQYTELKPETFIQLSKEDKKYLFNVLRCSPGEIVYLSDGKGKTYRAIIIDKQTVKIIEEESLSREEPFSIFLCQALLKGDKMEQVIQKATELGVKKILPFVSARCVVKETNKLQRWQKIAKEASEQSGRSIVPEIEPICSYNELIQKSNNGIIFWEKEQTPLQEALKGIDLRLPVFLIVGPEGGFSEEEIKIAERQGLKVATLGKRILRAETASIVSVAVVNFLLQNYDIIKQWN
ncbi:16S rRNA (uracil(1498)-N(3))-methyltransferase [Thermodesulfovibrio hydrogeniphilus]